MLGCSYSEIARKSHSQELTWAECLTPSHSPPPQSYCLSWSLPGTTFAGLNELDSGFNQEQELVKPKLYFATLWQICLLFPDFTELQSVCRSGSSCPGSFPWLRELSGTFISICQTSRQIGDGPLDLRWLPNLSSSANLIRPWRVINNFSEFPFLILRAFMGILKNTLDGHFRFPCI